MKSRIGGIVVIRMISKGRKYFIKVFAFEASLLIVSGLHSLLKYMLIEGSSESRVWQVEILC